MGTFVVVRAAVIFEVATDTPNTTHHKEAIQSALTGFTLYGPVEASVVTDVEAEDKTSSTT